ncbi:MAG: M28 family peptidase [Candidatus Zixiibacteriota bacterium]
MRFIAFAAEEQGLLGSASYAKEAHLRGDTILGVHNSDMTAWEHNGDNVIDIPSGNPPENQALADILIGAISDYGLNLVAQKITNGASDRSDQASFWNYNCPAILEIEDSHDLNPYYHGTDDRVSEFDTTYYLDFTRAAVAGTSILADPFIIGDANRDRLINAGDIVYLVNYLFRNDPAPVPLKAGDVTGDGIVNAGDIVYLVGYLYRAGPPPYNK